LRCGWSRRHPTTGKVPVEVEHIDGNWENNRLTNLTLLCPSCHSLTPTFRALNRGRGRNYRVGRSNEFFSLPPKASAMRVHLREVFDARPLQLELPIADVAQMVERHSCKVDVVGSSPTVGFDILCKR
jgi:hypothetical protein